MALRADDIQYVAIEGGNLDGRWYRKEWMAEARRGEKAGGAVFRPTGQITTRNVPTAMADPVTQETITVLLPQQAYVYREVKADQPKVDPRTRFACPVCPPEDIGSDRRKVAVYTRDAYEKHMATHLEEEIEYAKEQQVGTEVEYASTTDLIEKGLDVVQPFSPTGAPLAAPIDPFESIASALGISVEDVMERLKPADPAGEPVAQVSPNTEVPVVPTSGAESGPEDPSSEEAPDPQGNGADPEAPQPGGDQTPPAE